MEVAWKGSSESPAELQLSFREELQGDTTTIVTFWCLLFLNSHGWRSVWGNICTYALFFAACCRKHLPSTAVLPNLEEDPTHTPKQSLQPLEMHLLVMLLLC